MKEIPLRLKIGSALTAVSLLGGGYVAYETLSTDQDNSPSDESNTPTSTQIPPEVSTTPIPEITPKIEKYPLELGVSRDFGNVRVSLQKQLQETGIKNDPNQGKDEVNLEGIKVSDVELNTEEFPDAEEKLNEGMMYAHYLAWRSENLQERGIISFRQFKEGVSNGEDMTYTISGYKGEEILDTNKIIVDPNKRTHIILLSSPTTMLSPFAGYKYGFRSINDELYVEIYNYNGFEIHDTSGYNKVEFSLSYDIEWAFALLSDRESQESKAISSEAYVADQQRVYEFDQYIIPSKTADTWKGVIRVR